METSMVIWMRYSFKGNKQLCPFFHRSPLAFQLFLEARLEEKVWRSATEKRPSFDTNQNGMKKQVPKICGMYGIVYPTFGSKMATSLGEM